MAVRVEFAVSDASLKRDDAESPSEHELEYRLRTDDPTKDDFAKRMDAATRAACSPWQEHFSKSNNRPYWWNSKTNQKTWEKPPGV